MSMREMMIMSKEIFGKAQSHITERAGEMVAFSDYLAAHPELSEAEYETSRLMTEKLRAAGFEVEYPYLGLPTAFMAKKMCIRDRCMGPHKFSYKRTCRPYGIY